MEKMSNRERVTVALKGAEPDRVPYCELAIDRAFAAKALGWNEKPKVNALEQNNPFTLEEAKQVSAGLGLDNLFYLRRQPVYTETFTDADGRCFPGGGSIKTMDDLDMIALPDPHSDAFYAEAADFAANKGDYAAFFLTRGGLAPAMLSMGIDHFCISLYTDPDLVKQLLDLYFDWMEVVVERICQLDFDAFCMADDFAMNTGMMISPQSFEDLIMPYYRRIAKKMTIPWIFHSDGNIQQAIDMLADVGVSGIHPVEDGAMDIRATKAAYDRRLCILGNVNMDLLGAGTPEEVEKVVRELIRDVAPGGGYIMTSGNSLADYLKPECVRAISRTIDKYGHYPITME
jgi:uroporphyrinogen decarboxylase